MPALSRYGFLCSSFGIGVGVGGKRQNVMAITSIGSEPI
jgi:hypothetical protein